MSSHAEMCPLCRKESAHRSKVRWFGERWWKILTARRIFRCDNCGWRGWMYPMDRAGCVGIDVPPGPDLSDLDQDLK